MRKQVLNISIGMFVLCLIFSGCSQQGSQSNQAEAPEAQSMGAKMAKVEQKVAATAQEAINYAKKIEDVKAKKDYLIAQAQNFYKSEDFQQVVDVAQYVLAYVDKDSAEAKNLLDKAKKELQAAVDGAVTDVKDKMGSFGK